MCRFHVITFSASQAYLVSCRGGSGLWALDPPEDGHTCIRTIVFLAWDTCLVHGRELLDKLDLGFPMAAAFPGESVRDPVGALKD